MTDRYTHLFPEDTGATVDRIWLVRKGEEDGVLWAGVAPAALFKSEDGGRNWQPLDLAPVWRELMAALIESARSLEDGVYCSESS